MVRLLFSLLWVTQTRRVPVNDRVSLVEGKSASNTMDMVAKLAEDVVYGRVSIDNITLDALGAIQVHMDTVIASAESMFTAQQTLINTSLSNIGDCESEKSQHSSWENTATTKGDTHDECRERQADLKTDMDTKCTAFHNDARYPNAPTCMASSFIGPIAVDDIPSMMSCLREVRDWAGPRYTELVHLKALCDNATTLHDAEVVQCNADQTSYEEAFCVYHEGLTDSCVEYDNCRNRTETAHSQTDALVKTEETSFQAEWSAAKHVICLLDVLSETDSDEQKSKLLACRNLPTSSPELEINYGTVPQKLPCDTAPVVDKPCDEDWVESQYEVKSWFTLAPATICTSCAHLA